MKVIVKEESIMADGQQLKAGHVGEAVRFDNVGRCWYMTVAFFGLPKIYTVPITNLESV